MVLTKKGGPNRSRPRKPAERELDQINRSKKRNATEFDPNVRRRCRLTLRN
jgi:hypothetical protein